MGSFVEVGSTFITPFAVSRLDRRVPRPEQYDEEEEGIREGLPVMKGGAGLERFGLWGITSQLLCLVPVVTSVWWLSSSTDTPAAFRAFLPKAISSSFASFNTSIPGLTMFLFLSASRMGLWAYDITVQTLTQSRVDTQKRSAFAGTEASLVALFELMQWLLAAILNRREDFKWLAVIGIAAVAVSTITHAYWLWTQRGHLVHWEKVPCKTCI